MGEIVNLRTIRKQKQRDQKAISAAQNRALFGRSKAEQAKTKAELDNATRALDAHELDKE